MAKDTPKKVFFGVDATSGSENVVLDSQEKIEAYYSDILSKLNWNTQKKIGPAKTLEAQSKKLLEQDDPKSFGAALEAYAASLEQEKAAIELEYKKILAQQEKGIWDSLLSGVGYGDSGAVLTYETLQDAYNKLIGKKTVAKVADEEHTRQVLDMLSDMLDRWIENPRCVRHLEINMSNDMTASYKGYGMPPDQYVISTEYTIKISVMELPKE